MPVKYENFRGDIYYLVRKKTKKGNWQYYFTKNKKENLVDSIPDGYEIDEKPNGNVYLIKERPKVITEEEKMMVKKGVEIYSNIDYFKVYIKKEIITIYIAQETAKSLRKFIGPFIDDKEFNKYLTFIPVLRFILVDKNERLFEIERYCFRGSVDDWIPLDGGNLEALIEEYCRHLGEDSFYNLF